MRVQIYSLQVFVVLSTLMQYTIYHLLRAFGFQIEEYIFDYQLGDRGVIHQKPIVTIYSRVRNKHTPTIIYFLAFFQGLWPYSRLHRAQLSSISIRYKWGYACSFCQIFRGYVYPRGYVYSRIQIRLAVYSYILSCFTSTFICLCF